MFTFSVTQHSSQRLEDSSSGGQLRWFRRELQIPLWGSLRPENTGNEISEIGPGLAESTTTERNTD